MFDGTTFGATAFGSLPPPNTIQAQINSLRYPYHVPCAENITSPYSISILAPADTMATDIFKVRFSGAGAGGRKGKLGGGAGSTVIAAVSGLSPSDTFACVIGNPGKGGHDGTQAPSDGGNTTVSVRGYLLGVAEGGHLCAPDGSEPGSGGNPSGASFISSPPVIMGSVMLYGGGDAGFDGSGGASSRGGDFNHSGGNSGIGAGGGATATWGFDCPLPGEVIIERTT